VSCTCFNYPKTSPPAEESRWSVLSGNSKQKEEKVRQIILEKKENDWKEKTDMISGLMAKRRPITAESVANGSLSLVFSCSLLISANSKKGA